MVEDHASHLSPGARETVDLLHAAGRILAEPISADRDIPPFPRSTRDGYAVRSADLAQLPAKLTVMGEIKAGPQPARHLVRAESRRGIFHHDRRSCAAGRRRRGNGRVHIAAERTRHNYKRNCCGRKHCRARGRGQVRAAWCSIPGHGSTKPPLHLPPRLENPGCKCLIGRALPCLLRATRSSMSMMRKIGPTQIRNSNSYSLAAQIQEAGGEPVLLPIAPDEPQRLRELIEQGLQADLLLMTGGVSMGRYDLVEQVLAANASRVLFHWSKNSTWSSCRIRSRPMWRGRYRPRGASAPPSHKYFFGLPGNPVSTMVTFELFARPVLRSAGWDVAAPASISACPFEI